MPGSGHGCLDLSVFFFIFLLLFFFSFFFKALFLSASPAFRRLHFLVKSGTIQLQSPPSAFISALWCSASVLNKVYYLLKLFALRTCEPLEEGWFATKVGWQTCPRCGTGKLFFSPARPRGHHAETSLQCQRVPDLYQSSESSPSPSSLCRWQASL